jgi:hypothetical protein
MKPEPLPGLEMICRIAERILMASVGLAAIDKVYPNGYHAIRT